MAVEMAIVLPILIASVCGLYDTTQILLTWERMSQATDAMTQIATNFLVSPSNGDPWTMQNSSAQQATEAVFAYLPAWKQGGQYSITLSSIHTGGGAATTVWSYASAHGSQVKRPCGGLSAGTGSSMSQLPAAVINLPDGAIVADISFSYKPMFLMFFSGSISLNATSYLPPRTFSTTQSVEFTPTSDSHVTVCG